MALLHLINLLFAGLLAGVELVVHLVLGPSLLVLTPAAQLRLRQALILRLRLMVPALFVPATLTLLALAILEGGRNGRWLHLMALAAAAVWVATRVIATAPINKATLEWGDGTTPADWQTQVEHAERFHIAGALAAVLAFLCCRLV